MLHISFVSIRLHSHLNESWQGYGFATAQAAMPEHALPGSGSICAAVSYVILTILQLKWLLPSASGNQQQQIHKLSRLAVAVLQGEFIAISGCCTLADRTQHYCMHGMPAHACE